MVRVSVDECLARVEEIDRPDTVVALRSVIAIDPEAETRTRRVARDDAPLAGVPVLVKDNIEAEGLPGTAGSLALHDVPTKESTVVERLRRAGAIVVGAANLSEWANIRSTRSSSGWSAVGGLVSNPWMLDRSAGGSSSGSGAAVAAGIVSMAVGTETDGSITCPAALNGVVGIKPTVGLVPTDGVVPVSGSQDTPGPLARCVEDAAAMLAVVADDPALVDRSRRVDVASLRLGVVDAWRTGHADTDAVFDQVLSAIGSLFARVVGAGIEPTPTEVSIDEYEVLVHELRSDLDAYLARRCRSRGPRSLADVVAFNRENADRELVHFGQDIFERAANCSGRDAPEYVAARSRNVDWVRTRVEPFLVDHDVLVAPAYAPAWKTDFLLGHPAAGGQVTSPAAIAGWPIVTVPMGMVAGLPVALSLVAGPRSEAALIAVARAIEERLGLVLDPEWRPRFVAPTRG